MLDHPLNAAADLERSDRCDPAPGLAACRRAFLAQPASRRLGSLQIVDLSRLRQRLGNRWPDLRHRVGDLVDATVARSLGADDLCLEAGEDCRYILRIGTERREVERHGELLAADATARLCGTIPGGAAIRVSTVAYDLDAGLDGVTSMAALRARVAALGLVPDHGGGPAVAALLQRLQPRFRPILHLRKRLVSAYQLAVPWAPPGGDVAAQAELDLWSIGQAEQVLLGPRASREAGLVVNVSYPTLATMRWREPVMRHCRRLPRQSAERLIIEVLDLPAGLPQPRVRELMAYIRPFCLLIVARLPQPAPDLAHLAGSGIGALSLAAGSLPPEDRAMTMALSALAGCTRAAGLRSCLVDASSTRLCRAALAAGIDHLGGDALMPALAHPGRAFLIAR